MKLKARLIVAFFTIIFVPVFLTAIAMWGLSAYQIRAMENYYGIEGNAYENLSSSVQFLSKLTKNTYKTLQETAKRDPARLSDHKYLDRVNEKLSERFSYLVVKSETQILYKGTNDDIEEQAVEWPIYKDQNDSPDKGVYYGGDPPLLVKQVEFTLNNGKQGAAYIVTEMGKVVPQIKNLIVDVLITIVLILVLTSATLTVWIYKGIMTPMGKLKKAAQNIRDGNLDFTLTQDSKDEIGELCVDFEEMRKRLKDSAEEKIEYDRESKELLSNISHDLKTPITAVKGYVEGIMDGVADTPEKMDKYIRTIYNKANEMDMLINELTFYSKIDTNKIPYTFNKININDYFDDCVEELSLDLESKGIELAYFNYVDKDVLVIADAEQLRRVIHNIVNNSVKYIDKKKGFINMRIKDVGDFIQVEIEDNGKGIAAKDLPYVFDRFFRADTSRNSSKGGSGIGLSIVKKIVEDHGGKIWVTSRESTGTIMYFVLRKYQEVPMNE